MSDASEVSTLTDEALRKIGRNVVNFQKMEGMLKVLVSEANYSGPIKDLKNIVEKRRKTTSRKTLGQLSDEFIKSIYSEVESSDESNSDSANIWVSLSFKVDEGEKLASSLRELYRFIVSERNGLVHEKLVVFDPMSVESCRQLIFDLDSQAERLDPAYKNLQNLLNNFTEGKKLMAEAMLSEEVRSKLTNNNDDR